MLEQRLERITRGGLPGPLLWLREELGAQVAIDRPTVLWRASGFGRAGLVAHLFVPRLEARLALGFETPLAHVVVDRLLGFDRTLAESRLQLTPVEWGVWTFLLLRVLESIDPPGPKARADRSDGPSLPALPAIILDRVGPDAFDPSGLGQIVTVRWPIRVGPFASAMRLWLPESAVNGLLAAPEDSLGPLLERVEMEVPTPVGRPERGSLTGWWRALAGVVNMPQGLRRLRVGGVLPLAESTLGGTPTNLSGIVNLVLDLDGQNARFLIAAHPVAESGGRRIVVDRPLVREQTPRDPYFVHESEAKPMAEPHSTSGPPSTAQSASPLDVPVTLTVELGRVNVTLAQLADFKPGDVIELNRHSKSAVELTSNGRLVARGELILIDTDLGVRVTSVFL
jgi:type III secretion system YscQ/HrcQ family protein